MKLILSKGKVRPAPYLLLLSFLTLSSPVWSNDTFRSLSEVLEDIGERYQVFFTYDSERLSTIDVEFQYDEAEELSLVIDRLLSETHFTYEAFDDKYYVIYEKTRKGKKQAKKLRHHIKEISKLERKGLKLNRVRKDNVSHLQGVVETLSQVPVDKVITGSVKSADGEPLIGATILVKGTSVGSVTDFDGNFTVNAPDDAMTLVISFTGFESLEIAIDDQTHIDVMLNENVSLLNEVVVVGYGTVKKSDLTGSVSSVKAEDLSAFPTLGALEAMQGRGGWCSDHI